MRKTCGGYAKSGSWSPQGEGGNPSCASLGQAPGQGEKDVQDGEDRHHPEQSRIHAPQGDHLPESYRAEHLAEPFGDIVDPHRPAGSDLPGNRDFERIGSLRAGDDGIAQGEQGHAGESQTLVLINPDNPSGHCFGKKEVQQLLEWTKERRIALILDESFLDFAEDKEASLLTDEMLNRYPGLYIVKSISKSYGVPGLRLGILASQDKERLDRIKKAVSIWNINSMAEFFMQILDKYKKDYEEALVELRKERERFYRKLCQIEGLKVYPSSANYFMCELVNGRKSEELAAELLEEQILIKDLTGKIANGRQYVRIAVRSRRENEQLAEALKIKFL